MSIKSTENKLVLRLHPEMVAGMDELRVLMGNVDVQDAIRDAIGTALVIRRHMAKGWRPMLRKGDAFKEMFWSDEGRL